MARISSYPVVTPKAIDTLIISQGYDIDADEPIEGNPTGSVTIGSVINLLNTGVLPGTGTVTSLGVSMPSAFTVSNSPVTTTGVINITGSGTSTQYIDGTGSLQSSELIFNRDSATNSLGNKTIQSDFNFSSIPASYANSIWNIVHHHDLGGATVTLPAGVTLNFTGGKFSNGTLTGNNTKINSFLVNIFNTDTSFSGTWSVKEVYPQWFGAVGDGVTDDLIPINSSIDFISQEGVLHFPKAVYLISDSIKFSKNITIFGNNSTIKLKSGSYSDVQMLCSTIETSIFSNPRATTIENLHVKDLILDVNNVTLQTPSSSSISGLFIRDCKNCIISNIEVINMPTNIQEGYAVGVIYCDNVQMEKIFVESSGRQNLIVWECLKVNIDNVKLNGSYNRECILVSTNTPITYQKTKEVNISNAILQNELGGLHIARISGEVEEVNINNIILKSTNALTSGLKIISPSRININNLLLECRNYGIYVINDNDKYINITNSQIKADQPFNCVVDIRSLSVSNTSIVSSDSTQKIVNIQYVDDVMFNNCVFDGGLEITFFQFLNLMFNGNLVKNNLGASYSLFAVQPDVNSKGVVNSNLGYNLTSPLFRVDIDNGAAVGNRVNLTGSVTTSGQNGFNSY